MAPRNPLLYQVDWTGIEPSHYIHHEKLDAPYAKDTIFRVVLPTYGGFFADTLKVYDKNRNLLKPNYDYYATFKYEDATYHTGREIMGAILVVGGTEVESVFVSAQFLGSTYATQKNDVVTDTISEWFRSHPGQYAKWGEIIGEPTKYNDDRYKYTLWRYDGYEPTVASLEDINRTIILGRANDIKDYASQFDKGIEEIRQRAVELRNNVNTHSDNKNNPHLDMFFAVGLHNELRNWPLAKEGDFDQDQAVSTPRELVQAYDKVFGVNRIANHTTSKNPHDDHVKKLGGYTRQEIDNAIDELMGLSAVASDTLLLEGQSEESIVMNARSNVYASSFTNGRPKKAMLGTGTADEGAVLTGTGQWVSLKDLVARAKPSYTVIRWMYSDGIYKTNTSSTAQGWHPILDNVIRNEIPSDLGNNAIVVYGHYYSVNVWNGANGLNSADQKLIRYLGNNNGTWS